jgi:hypothetical protein
MGSTTNYDSLRVDLCSSSSTTSGNEFWPCPTVEVRIFLNLWITRDCVRPRWPKHIEAKWGARKNVVLEVRPRNECNGEDGLTNSEDPPTKNQSMIALKTKENQRSSMRVINAELIPHRRNLTHTFEPM